MLTTVSPLKPVALIILKLLDDPFMTHFAGTNEMGLARYISDVKNDKWLLKKANRGSVWSSSFRYPASLKHLPLTGSKIPQSTQDLDVRKSTSILTVILIPV